MAYQEILWEKLLPVNEQFWKNKDTIKLIEISFILKGKEPPSQVKLRYDMFTYPVEFCEFQDNLFGLVDSSLKVGALKPINPSYSHGGITDGNELEFICNELIQWVSLKGFDVPEWLYPESSKNISCEKNESIHYLVGIVN